MDCSIILLIMLQIIPTIQRSEWVRRLSTENKIIHCKPVVCPTGYQVSFCKQNYTDDYCHQCPVGTIQEKAVNSSSVKSFDKIPKCVSTGPSCPPEAVLVNDENGRPSCQCDTTRGFAGENYMICIQCRECPPGMELKLDGQCSTCSQGTWKPAKGYGPCKSFTNCEEENRETLSPGNTTADAVCGELLTTSTPSTLPVPISPTIKPQPEALGLSIKNDGLDDISLSQDEHNLIYSSDEMETRVMYNSQERLMLVSMTLQITFTIMIFLILLIGIFQIRRLSRDVHTRRDEGSGKDEERSLLEVTTHTETEKETVRMKNEATLCHEYGSEPGCVSLYQPVTMETVYPMINSRPCTPTAPQPSIIDFQNKC